MSEEEKKKLEEAAAAGAEAGAGAEAANAAETGAEAGAEAGAAAGAEAGVEVSAKDKARNWMKGRNPDLDMEDEDAYYGAVNDTFDQYDQYENATKNLQGAIDMEGSMMGQMIAAATQDPNFNPIAWIKKETGMDLTEAMDDDAFAKAMGEAVAAWEEKQTKGKEAKTKIAANFPTSMEAIDKFAEEKGQSEEEKNALKEEMFSIVDEALDGNFEGLYQKLYQAGNYEGDMEKAREEGKAAGRQTKVDDKLRTFPTSTSRGGGATAMNGEGKEKEQPYNPFVARKG